MFTFAADVTAMSIIIKPTVGTQE